MLDEGTVCVPIRHCTTSFICAPTGSYSDFGAHLACGCRANGFGQLIPAGGFFFAQFLADWSMTSHLQSYSDE